jgi:succinate-semialdehyde dehydrogenase / glutarate-semialdehyde dehydrogenase
MRSETVPYDYRLFIDGQWRNGAGGEEIPLIDPARAVIIGRVAKASSEDLADALDAARRARAEWRAVSPRQRGQILIDAARLLEPRIEAAAKALCAEQGKTIAEATGEYARAIETLIWNGEQAETLCAPFEVDPARYIAPEPIGVVAAFTPWNYPAVLNARKLAAPLAAGCPVILKGAEETPSSAVFLVEALVEAGLPAGVVNLIFGDPPAISEALLGASAVKVLTFTGSTPVGKQLARIAASNLQRCVLELGGHSPVIVFADADLESAVQTITDYKFECAGQSCNAPSRLLIESAVYDEVVARLTTSAEAIRIGCGDEEGVEMGPMANARRIAAMERLTADAVNKGATVLTGGKRLSRSGFFWPPTILADVPANALVMNEEPFGPILTVERFTAIDEAIVRANETDFGLASYVFSASVETQARMIGALSAGSVSVNTMKGVSAGAPNAGINDSGYGYEGGIEGFRAFQNLKLVNIVPEKAPVRLQV